MIRFAHRFLIGAALLASLAACTAGPQVSRADQTPGRVSPRIQAMYGEMQDGDMLIPAVDPKYLSAEKARQEVDYWTDEEPGTIVVDPYARYLYYVLGGNRAMRYTVAVGEAGRGFSGTATIPVKREWPRWTPTKNMLREDPDLYGPVADGMEGGLDNPLGARALYLYRGGRDTMYRIHGTSHPWSIGRATSAGCIRLFNQDSIDLAERVEPGTRVVVLTEAQSGQGTVPPATTVALADASF
ncbi:L,D-transpeptidase [Celeribacter indicus]|uniref:ErfK/YbiS/YcfS/YnhG family protein n=1 Tax=Celeribacter indicus TaxID=1208324 RepID=A0A0B5E7J3_9RHOB|nr:L,D-transpeptidase [Celeribacter indicus]AJE49036.1 ErfK/YbiS/YcfS/YnhG family protein [Celeribacter indicus]SDW44281.1 Lipoprotein-anchoring transpeptidase ErfK/SrfK [Celeribacter indicus]